MQTDGHGKTYIVLLSETDTTVARIEFDMSVETFCDAILEALANIQDTPIRPMERREIQI